MLSLVAIIFLLLGIVGYLSKNSSLITEENEIFGMGRGF
jgi:hypothetical protein